MDEQSLEVIICDTNDPISKTSLCTNLERSNQFHRIDIAIPDFGTFSQQLWAETQNDGATWTLFLIRNSSVENRMLIIEMRGAELPILIQTARQIANQPPKAAAQPEQPAA